MGGRTAALVLVCGGTLLACGEVTTSTGRNDGSGTDGNSMGGIVSNGGGAGTGGHTIYSGGASAGGAGGAGAATSGGSAGAATGGAGTDDAGTVSCAGGTVKFPDFDRSCVTDADCTLVRHQTNCCGSIRATGINRGVVEAFDAAEAICESQYPGCGCAPYGVASDDGTVVMIGEDDRLMVACESGVCRSKYGGGTFACGASVCTDLDACQVTLGAGGGANSYSCSPRGACSSCSCLTAGCECTKGPTGFTVTCDSPCPDGVCCAPGLTTCNGVCVDLAWDTANCGACGAVCPVAGGTPSCVQGICCSGTCGGCTAGLGDCDGDPANGCETNFETDPSNCGHCGLICASGTTCAAGACM